MEKDGGGIVSGCCKELEVAMRGVGGLVAVEKLPNAGIMEKMIAENKQKIGELLEKHHLRLKWYEIFDRILVKVEDENGKEITTMRGIDALMLQQQLLLYLLDYSPTKE